MKFVSAFVHFTFAVVAPVVVACGGAQQPAENPATPSPSSSAAPTAGAPEWKDMDHAQRLEFMAKVVLPKMKAEFVADGKHAGEFTCATCHGAGAKNGSFTMPNPDLPKLSSEGGYKKHMEKTPEITKFMMTKVVPDMAALVGEKPYDSNTRQGFGCVECHTTEK